MLRITLDETEDQLTIRLEGRIAGAWVQELRRTWAEVAARKGTKLLTVDLRSVTYADEDGKQVLRNIYSQAPVQLTADTPWTQFLAKEIEDESRLSSEEGPKTC